MTIENLKNICKSRNVQITLGCLWFESWIVGRIKIRSFGKKGSIVVKCEHSNLTCNCSNEFETELDNEIKNIKKIKIKQKIRDLEKDFEWKN